ncbi:TIR domain-containing protein [Moraxella osloensis]|nr:TIR domain-containing protein [Moraxella osloensis]
MINNFKNVFISHYGKDDEHVQNLKQLLKSNGMTIKNSSIDSTKPNQASNESYIKGLLRDRIRWAGTTIVLIGPRTHTRDWVNWEIEQSVKQGNRVVGIYINGGTTSDLPENFKKYGSALVGWRSETIIKAIEGKNNFQDASGHTLDSLDSTNNFNLTRGTC